MYQYETRNVSYTEIQEMLDNMASSGWKLHTIVLCSDGTWELIFERQL